jgi:hypothetical protein
MPHYFFDTNDGHRLVDPAGSNCKNDTAAIEKAEVLALGVSVDNPAVDPTRRISVLNADRVEIATVPVYSQPAWFDARDAKKYAIAPFIRPAAPALSRRCLAKLQHTVDVLWSVPLRPLQGMRECPFIKASLTPTCP